MIGVLGSGSWATAVVKLLLEQPSARVCWYVREPEIRKSLLKHGHNNRYLGEVTIDPARIEICSTPQEVADRCEIIYLVIPTAFLHAALQLIDPATLRQRQLVSAIKGFVPEVDMIVTDYLQHCYQVPQEQLAIISGPTHAEEVARERLTFITAASPNHQLAETVMQQLRCRYINISYSSDMRGIQFATALKNIYAVAAGICKGMGSGDNLMAVLVSYTLPEMRSFLKVMQPDTFVKISPQNMPPYVGDLLVTCYSQLSRNRTFGTMIGRGYTVKSAQLEMHMIAEGYYAVKSLEKVRREHHIEMPIAQAVYMILSDPPGETFLHKGHRAAVRESKLHDDLYALFMKRTDHGCKLNVRLVSRGIPGFRREIPAFCIAPVIDPGIFFIRFLKLIGRHQNDLIDSKAFDVRDFLYDSRKCSLIDHPAPGMLCIASYMQVI